MRYPHVPIDWFIGHIRRESDPYKVTKPAASPIQGKTGKRRQRAESRRQQAVSSRQKIQRGEPRRA
jgi:hypothetical protein